MFFFSSVSLSSRIVRKVIIPGIAAGSIKYGRFNNPTITVGSQRVGFMSTEVTHEAASESRSSLISRIWEAKYKIFTFSVLTYGAVMLLTERNQRVQLDESANYLYMAEGFQNEKNYRAAQENYEKCYQTRANIFGKQHPLTRNSFLFLLQNLALMESYDRMITMINDSEMLKQESMTSHADILFLRFLHGFAEDHLNRKKESEHFFHLFYSSFFSESTNISELLKAFNYVYSFITTLARHGRLKEAENLTFQFYSKFQQNILQLQNQMHIELFQEMLLNLLELLSNLARNQEQFIVAEQLLLQYVEMSRSFYAANHLKLSSILIQIADFYQLDLMQPGKARDYYLECYNRYKIIFGEDHPMIVRLLLSLGKCDFQMLQLRIGTLLKSHYHDPEDSLVPDESFPSQNNEELEWLIQESLKNIQEYYEKQLRLTGIFSEDAILAQFELGTLYLWVSKYRKHQGQESLSNYYHNQAKYLLSSCYWTLFHFYGAGHPQTRTIHELLSNNFPNSLLSSSKSRSSPAPSPSLSPSPSPSPSPANSSTSSSSSSPPPPPS